MEKQGDEKARDFSSAAFAFVRRHDLQELKWGDAPNGGSICVREAVDPQTNKLEVKSSLDPLAFDQLSLYPIFTTTPNPP